MSPLGQLGGLPCGMTFSAVDPGDDLPGSERTCLAGPMMLPFVWHSNCKSNCPRQLRALTSHPPTRSWSTGRKRSCHHQQVTEAVSTKPFLSAAKCYDLGQARGNFRIWNAWSKRLQKRPAFVAEVQRTATVTWIRQERHRACIWPKEAESAATGRVTIATRKIRRL